MSCLAESDPDALIAAGYRARRKNQPAEAKDAFAKAVNISRKLGEKSAGAHFLLAESLTGLGQIERDLGEIPAALQHYQEAAEVYRSLDETLALAHALRHVGNILRSSGDAMQAVGCYDKALLIYRGHPETSALDLANTLRGYALLKADTGHVQAAIAFWQEARALYVRAGKETGLDHQPGIDESDRQIARLSALER